MVESALSGTDVNVEDVAAVVGGRIITHQQVDESLALERARLGLTDDKAWNDYLESSGTSEFEVRTTIVHHMVDMVLVELEAERLGINVDDDVQARMDSLEALYPSRQAFLDAIAAKGYTEETYAAAVRQNLLWEALRDAVIPVPEPTEEQIREYAVVVAPTLAGRRSSHILLPASDYPLAFDVLSQLDSGADFAELASQYSIDGSAADGGDVGWDSLNTFVPLYQETLDGLEPGEYSGLVLTRFGYHIILCTDKYEVATDAEGNIDLAQIPDDLMDVIIRSMSQSLTSQLFSNYIVNLEATVPIAVFDQKGVQIPNAAVGLAVEVVEENPSTDDVVNRVIDEARDRTQSAIEQLIAGFKLSSDVSEPSEVSDMDDPESAVLSAVEHTDFFVSVEDAEEAQGEGGQAIPADQGAQSEASAS